MIMDKNKAFKGVVEYDPWGRVALDWPGFDDTKKFTGQEYDDATGLYYYVARYYDPDLGRFLSPDPIVQAPFNSQNLNRYSYVLNNPVMFVDPTGNITIFSSGSGGPGDDRVGGSGGSGIVVFPIFPIFFGPSGTQGVDSPASGGSGNGGGLSPNTGEHGRSIEIEAFLLGQNVPGTAVPYWADLPDLQSVLQRVGGHAAIATDWIFRNAVFDYQDPLGGSLALEAMTLIPVFKVVKFASKGVKIAGKVTGFTRHGINQIISRDGGRGVSNTYILETLRNPTRVVRFPDGSIKYFGQGSGNVLVNAGGRVITAAGKKRGPVVLPTGKGSNALRRAKKLGLSFNIKDIR